MTTVAAFALLATPAFAQEPGEGGAPESPPDIAVREAWSGDLKAGVYLPRLDGDIELGGPAINLADNLDLDDLEPTVNVELTLRRNGRQLRFNGFDFSTDTTGLYLGTSTFGSVSLNTGDAFSASADLFGAGVEFGIDLKQTTIDGKPMKDWKTSETELRITPRFGMRYVDYDQVVSEVGVSVQNAGGEWLIPYAGIELLLRFEPEGGLIIGRGVRLSAGTTMGPAIGGDDGFAWSVRATMSIDVTDNIAFMFGYRLLELDVDNDGFNLDGGLQGLFLGTTIRF
jgi:hypothetical protein